MLYAGKETREKNVQQNNKYKVQMELVTIV